MPGAYVIGDAPDIPDDFGPKELSAEEEQAIEKQRALAKAVFAHRRNRTIADKPVPPNQEATVEWNRNICCWVASDPDRKQAWNEVEKEWIDYALFIQCE